MKKYIVTLFAAALVLGSSQVARADITSGLTGYWNFDEGSGASAADASGNGNTLTLINGASWTAGEIGASAETLDGSSQYARLPASAFGSYPASGATNSYSVTFSTWFKTTSAGVILGQDAAVDPPSTVSGYVPGIYIDAAGKIRASIFWHGSTASQIVTPGSYNDGAWHQVVDTYAAGTETLYVDGASAGTQSVIESGYSSAYYFFLGTGFANAWPGMNSGWGYFNGSLDDTRVYGRALSSSDVAELYAYTGSQTVKQGGGHSQAGGTGGTSALSGWAWSSNTGWISFNSDDSGTGNGGTGKSPFAYSVSVSTTTGSNTASFSGYAWSSSLGWVSFQSSDLTGCAGATPASAAVDSNGNLAGQITGFVRVLSEVGRSDGWDGCARLGDPTAGSNQLSPASATFNDAQTGGTYLRGGVTYVQTANTGFFKGFAWASTVLGWLSFENPLAPVKIVGTPPVSNPDFVLSNSKTIALSTQNNIDTTTVTIAAANGNTATQVITPTISGLPSGMNAAFVNSPGNCTLDAGTISCTYQVRVTLGSATTGSYSFNVVGTRSDAVAHSTIVGVNVDTTQPPTGGGAVSLYIGKTVAAIDGATHKPTSLDIKKDNPFALEWSINLPSDEYSCNPPLVNKGSWAGWTGTDLSFTGSGGSGSVASIDTTPGSDPASTYIFSVQCTSNKGNPAVTGSATLILESSSESEI